MITLRSPASRGARLGHEMYCSLCGARTKWASHLRSEGEVLLECSRCGLVSLCDDPTQIATATEDYDRWTSEKSWEVEKGRSRLLKTIAARLERRKSGGRLLDVGCSCGVLFGACSPTAWERFGIEPSRQAAELAMKRFPSRVLTCNLREANWPDRLFDAVTILDSLYYMPDPGADLKESFRVLKEDGVLYVEVPNLEYSLYRSHKAISSLLDRRPSRLRYDQWHKYLFPTVALVSFLSSVGFAVEAIVPLGVPERSNPIQSGADGYLARMLARVYSASHGLIDVAPKILICASKRLAAARGTPDGPDQKGLVIREADNEDLDEICQMHVSCFARGAASASPGSLRRFYAAEMGDGVDLAVAFAGEKRVGFAEARCPGSAVAPGYLKHAPLELFPKFIASGALVDESIKKLILKSYEHSRRSVEIRAVGVAEGYRNRQVGSMLIRFLVERISAKGRVMLFAWISLSNLPSIRAFNRNGFHLAAVRTKNLVPEGLFIRDQR